LAVNSATVNPVGAGQVRLGDAVLALPGLTEDHRHLGCRHFRQVRSDIVGGGFTFSID